MCNSLSSTWKSRSDSGEHWKGGALFLGALEGGAPLCIPSVFSQQPIHSTKMVLTVAQITSFFEDADQMGLTHRTRTLSLNTKGIITVGELAEWKDDYWDQWKNNCKKPDRIPDPENPANLIHQTQFKSLKRLKAASELIRYYESVSIELTAMKIRWPVI